MNKRDERPQKSVIEAESRKETIPTVIAVSSGVAAAHRMKDCFAPRSDETQFVTRLCN
jgi:hypothetical protein